MERASTASSPRRVPSPLCEVQRLSPNNNGALGNVKVRPALEYAIDKVAIENSWWSVAQPAPRPGDRPGAEGYVPFDDYPTPGNEGDPGKCRQLRKAAGLPGRPRALGDFPHSDDLRR